MRTRLIVCAVVTGLAALGGVPGAAGGLMGGVPTAHPKRGIASSRYLASDPAALSRIGAAWAYDWSLEPPARRSTLSWAPMVWGPGSMTPATLASLKASRRTGRADDLLGFNEPDSPSQSNLSPERAASLWPWLERTGLRLGSPAPAVPTDGWLARFMSLARVRRLRVDFMAVHYYQDFTNPAAVAELRRELVEIHSEYHKPVWITEIGALDLRRWHEPMVRPPTVALATAYMRNLFAMLDVLRFVERYAWFTDGCWGDAACRSSSLFTRTGRVTPAGSAFSTAP